MSEYVKFEIEPTDDPNTMLLITNQTLSHDEAGEFYPTPEAGEEGSPIAQALFFGVAGIQSLTLQGQSLTVTREADAIWDIVLDDIRNTLRDFFL
ncbi:MAG: NifU N-terminal domain-containing protein [bacterium]|nr:NifU N-terminal domain-containing protein [bacterium]